ncbi:MAG: serine/threonine-protein kinase [Candidatus Eisenbacteria bacterium]
MAEDREQRLREVFAEAMALEPANRAAFLLRACGPDEALRVEVESLLDAHERAGSFLESPALLDLTERDLQERMPVHLGRQIGPYRLVTEIGVGGMGTVYLGERADGSFEQRVAVKLLRFGLGTSELRRAFENERRILARLEHPNIARLIDGGTTEDGTPYLAMEYVPGIPIDQYCNEGTLSVPARVEIMRTVCDAVHHAHRNLVVHRDLKPSNILVDESGRVKLLDFGIAKVIVPDLPDAGGSTRTRVPALTPRYASPEQLRGEPVTTASDVYSLGVVLYELPGRREPDTRNPRKTGGARSMRPRRDPMRPSDAVRLQGSRPIPGDDTRKANPARRELVGDLVTIVMQCLRKSRVAGTPPRNSWRISAGTSPGFPCARGRTRSPILEKFVRRHPGSVIAGTFAVLTLITASLVSTGFHLRAIHAREDADRGRAAAQRTSAFLQEVLGSIDPQVAQGRDVTLPGGPRPGRVPTRARARGCVRGRRRASSHDRAGLPISRSLRARGAPSGGRGGDASRIRRRGESCGGGEPGRAGPSLHRSRALPGGRGAGAGGGAVPCGRHRRCPREPARSDRGWYRPSGCRTVRARDGSRAEGAMEDAEAGHAKRSRWRRTDFPPTTHERRSFSSNLGVASAPTTGERRPSLLRRGIEILRRGREKPVDLSIASQPGHAAAAGR